MFLKHYIFQKPLLFCFIVGYFHLSGQSNLNVKLLDSWNSDTIIHNSYGVKFSDVWGYEQNGREYAMICSTEGVHFFEVIDDKLKFADFVKGTFSSTTVVNRDVTTFKHYAYTVCDHGPSNLQIIDLSYLPDSVSVVATIGNNFGRGHNVFVDEENELLYVCRVTPIINGNPTFVIPMRVFSLSDPLNPQLLYEGPSGVNEVHDIWVQNNIAVLNCGFDGLRVYNFSNPSAPQFIQNLNFYQHQGYNHQGAMTPDGFKYVFADETSGKMIKLCEIGIDHRLTIRNYFGTNFQNNSIPHNIMCSNEFAFVAYYNEGLRIYDLRNAPKEIAHYDTYPDESDFKMNGAWGIYSNLPSGKLLVSDIQYGLFLLDFDRTIFLQKPEEVIVYPTVLISEKEITVQLKHGDASIFSVKIVDTAGKILQEQNFMNQTYGKLTADYSSGVYFVEVSYFNYLNELIKKQIKIIIG